MAKAQRLKVEEGSVILGNSRPGETIVLEPYASNIIRITLSLNKDDALSARRWMVRP